MRSARLELLALLLALGPRSAQALEGRVVDLADGRPIAGAVVTRGAQVVVTDEAGRFAVAGCGGALAARAVGYRGTALLLGDEGCAVSPLGLVAFRAKALYLSFWGFGDRRLREAALELADATEVNALVIDVKGDRGWVPYASRVPLAETVGARRITTVRDAPGLLAELKARGLYLIARVVVFKDDPLAIARPEWAVKTAKGGAFKDREGLGWTDASLPEVWRYNLDLAEEAALLGFDEVQFDYVRFPDAAGLVFSVPNTEAARVGAISGFLDAAGRRLAPYNVFVSADLFGYVLWNENDTGIGQRLEDLARQVDYLSPMLYPSGFHLGIPGFPVPVAHPGAIVERTLARGLERSGLSPLRFRPWLQAFRDYAFDARAFGGPEVREQVDAAERLGVGGWMLWNPHNVYARDGLREE